MANLDTNIKYISGEAAAKRMAGLEVKTVEDLLYFFPFRHEDYREITPIAALRSGQFANIVGTIEIIQNKRSPRKRMNITEAIISDETDQAKAVWFNQPFIAKNLKEGDKVSLSGKVAPDYGGFSLKSPAYEKIFSGRAVHTQGLVPVYHSTANLTQKHIRFMVNQVIGLAEEMSDWLPEHIIKEYGLMPLSKAIRQMHFPSDPAELEKARRRLAFNELFLIQLQAQIIKRSLKNRSAPKIKFLEKETREFVNNLPFTLTDAQKKAAWEILTDLEKGEPMARLLEGDVGSGKTVVAALALLNCALNKKQAVLMVPTEILAFQHYENLRLFFNKYDLNISLITGSRKEMESNESTAKKIFEIIKKGGSKIIIGTHALIQEKIAFKNLSLAIIDEQHRFGVEQRKTLIDKAGGQNGSMPHLLSMTATPIPRSLALALFGDLDLSIINEMPKGRKKIITRVVSENKRETAYKFVRERVEEGRQVFVICPLIDISDKLGVKSAKEEYEKLNKLIFPDLNIGLLHGRMKPAEKEKIMNDFNANKLNVLVSTSVIEVGIDVPNATVMMIEGADRFGLAQLHQFRGRIGRGEHQSYCLLFTDNGSEKTIQRLEALVKYHDGFALAKVDLEFRGPGEIYGTAQKGFPELKVATLFDHETIKKSRASAIKIIEDNPDLSSYPKLKNKLSQWEAEYHPE
jgi:ATP-dependent DNA helicase RecG